MLQATITPPPFAVGAVLEPIRTLQGLIGRRGGARRWRRLMLIRFRSREAAMAVLRPLCHCPGPLGMWAIDRRLLLAFRRTPLPPLDEQLPLLLPYFRLMLPDGALFTEEKVPIPVVIVSNLRAMADWLPAEVRRIGGISYLGLGLDGATYLTRPSSGAKERGGASTVRAHWQVAAAQAPTESPSASIVSRPASSRAA